MLGATLVLGFLGGLLASVASPNIKAVTLNVNVPEVRGVAFALQVRNRKRRRVRCKRGRKKREVIGPESAC
jgi:hypothetical protein